MNRHKIIMNMKRIPKNVNLDNINKIFSEYEHEVKLEKESNLKIVYPK